MIWTNPHYKARNVYFQFGHKAELLRQRHVHAALSQRDPLGRSREWQSRLALISFEPSVRHRVEDDVDADRVGFRRKREEVSGSSASRSQASGMSVLWIITTMSRPRASAMPRASGGAASTFQRSIVPPCAAPVLIEANCGRSLHLKHRAPERMIRRREVDDRKLVPRQRAADLVVELLLPRVPW